MRVMLPNGTIMEVAKVVVVCEHRFTFNGRSHRLCECATDIASANGVVFSPEKDIATGGAVMLGNLSNEFCQGVLASLVRQGYTDLSGLKLQKAQPVSSYVFDHGASGAYMLQGYEVGMCCANVLGCPPFVAGESPVASEAEDGEGAEEAGEEDGDE